MSSKNMSRKEFLTLLGGEGTLFLFGGGFARRGGSLNSLSNKYNRNGIGASGSNINSNTQLAYAQTSGNWLPVQSSTSIVAIHTYLLLL
jgi:hypothetical protein